MGIGKKRKEMTAMKRSTILSVAVIFAIGTMTAAPVSFAAKNNDSGTANDSGYELDNEIEDTEVVKDTSWFDYENQKDIYEISNEAQLMGLASLVNENQTDRWKPTRIENFENVTFKLTNDIELTKEWTPIGTGGASYFAGTFDGNGYTISNLEINSNSGAAGLFGYLTGEVKNLNVEGKATSGDESCGAIAGHLSAEGKITGCTSDVSISGKDKTGGIVGYNEGGSIRECINLGNVSGTYKVGGIVGENWGGTITMCGNKGKVKSSKRGVATYGTGGVAGRSVSAEASISQSYNTGEVVSDTEATGGITGYINAEGSSITECYNTGSIRILNKDESKELSKAYAGGIAGIAGMNGVVIRNCYNAGNILNADVSGGVIGKYINEYDEQKSGSINNNYYLNDTAKSAIGEIDDERDRSAAKAATGVSRGALNSLAMSLSSMYRNDTGMYGNGGYPVLTWQETVSEDEKDYITGISSEIQDMLDEYIMKNSDSSQYGQLIINFFTPANYMNDAILSYNESKAKEKNEEEE